MGILAQKEMLTSAAVARVMKEKCSLCLTCVEVCPFKVPVIHEHALASYIDPAKCQGCGVCVAECPMGAIELMHNREDQTLSEIKAAFG
jgi:heterodisulfide reductase subunit A